VLARLSSKHSIAIELLWRKAVRPASLPHFVVDEREIEIDIPLKDSPFDRGPEA
jgi:hypothetical protein